jgi:hypothetical protein
MRTGGLVERKTVNSGIQSAKSCLRAFVPEQSSTHVPFSCQTFFAPPGVEILDFVTPYASLCRQRRLRNRPGRRWRELKTL